jgi:hypothetical protein
VLQITYGNTHALLCGDIEGGAWNTVVGHPDFRSPHILKASHHGSRDSSPPATVVASGSYGRERWALLSTPSRSAKHPHISALRTFWRADWWRTRCTGWSPVCKTSDQEWSPPAPSRSGIPRSLRDALVWDSPTKVAATYERVLSCCFDNAIAIDAAGNVTHSRAQKSCDARPIQIEA